MLFTKVNQSNIGHLHYLFFVFTENENFFHQFFWLCNETGNANSFFFLVHSIDSQLKSETMKSTLTKRSANYRKSNIHAEFTNLFLLLVKDQFGIFLLFENTKISFNYWKGRKLSKISVFRKNFMPYYEIMGLE